MQVAAAATALSTLAIAVAPAAQAAQEAFILADVSVVSVLVYFGGAAESRLYSCWLVTQQWLLQDIDSDCLCRGSLLLSRLGGQLHVPFSLSPYLWLSGDAVACDVSCIVGTIF